MNLRNVAIIGAGFSGLLVALHLLRADGGIKVHLIEKADVFGRGLAYGAADRGHLLNVRAGNMSAFPEEPNHFVEWLRGSFANDDGDLDFVPRQLYGTYLQDLLRARAGSAAGVGRLNLVPDEAVAVSTDPLRVRLALGRSLAVDAVVLATGNLPPHGPPGFTSQAGPRDRRVKDPWSDDSFAGLETMETVLLVGTGLTAVDMVIKLNRMGHQGRIIALSRRGLRPRAHRDGTMAATALPFPAEVRLSALLRMVREAARHDDWRAVVDGLRPHTQRIWQRATTDERLRFLRHLRPWWDVHRHRLAPAVAATVEKLVQSGQVSVHAGRIVATTIDDTGVRVEWRARRSSQTETMHVNRVFNCTGPTGDLRSSRLALHLDLLEHGRFRPDSCHLGVDVDASSRVVAAKGHVHPGIFAVGPVCRGAFWEVTAVPDIRVQAQRIATDIVQSMAADAQRKPVVHAR